MKAIATVYHNIAEALSAMRNKRLGQAKKVEKKQAAKDLSERTPPEFFEKAMVERVLKSSTDVGVKPRSVLADSLGLRALRSLHEGGQGILAEDPEESADHGRPPCKSGGQPELPGKGEVKQPL